MHIVCEGRVLPLVSTSKEIAMVERKELSEEDVAHRAYELYVQRGSEPGKDVEDWVRAEKELSSETVAGSVGTNSPQVGRN
jgi:Protein of unknown function (DUF2934)